MRMPALPGVRGKAVRPLVTRRIWASMKAPGLIRSVLTTPANVNDTVPADLLIRGDEQAVLADAAYHTHPREAALRARGIKPRLMRRANKHHPVLPPRLKRYNRLIARRRAAVDT